MKKPTKKQIEEFLRESNAIEQVYSEAYFNASLRAWKFLVKQKKISESVILETHKILMEPSVILEEWKGAFRIFPVYIGGKMASRWENIPIRLDEWYASMNIKQADENTAEGKEWYAKTDHVEYEHIHPFADGNGRTGRMFMNWWRIKNGLPLLIIHQGEEQYEYYKWFKESAPNDVE